MRLHIYHIKSGSLWKCGERGVNRCPNLQTEMDKSRFCRPHSIRLVSDSVTTRQVKK
jgi:hypothetical protein